MTSLELIRREGNENTNIISTRSTISISDLPPEILDEIFSYLSIRSLLIYRSKRRYSTLLSRLSRVSKNWRASARTALIRELKVACEHHRYGIDKLLSGLENSKEGWLIRKVSIDISPTKFYRHNGIVREEDFIRLINLLPNVQHLFLTSWNSNYLTDQNFTPSNFTNLTTFELQIPTTATSVFAPYRNIYQIDLLESILSLAPSIVNLYFFQKLPAYWVHPHPSVPTFSSSIHHPLKRLKLSTDWFHQIFLSNLDTTPFFHISSFKGLVEITIKSEEFKNPTLLLDIFNIAGPTLLKLALFKPPPWNLTRKILNLCTRLEELYVYHNRLLPENFLSHYIPSTVTKFRPSIPLSWLQHLSKYPRPSLNLIDVTLEHKDNSSIPFLPDSIRRINFKNRGHNHLKFLYQHISESGRIPSDLKEVSLPLNWLLDVGNLELIKKLAEVGIRVTEMKGFCE